MRYLAWLAAIPKGAKISRREAYAETHEPEPWCKWLVEEALDCGLRQADGMSLSPVPWSEVLAWAQATERDGLWIRQAVRDLSVAYVDQYAKSEDPVCPSPLDVDLEQQRKTVQNQLKRFIANRS